MDRQNISLNLGETADLSYLGLKVAWLPRSSNINYRGEITVYTDRGIDDIKQEIKNSKNKNLKIVPEIINGQLFPSNSGKSYGNYQIRVYSIHDQRWFIVFYGVDSNKNPYVNYIRADQNTSKSPFEIYKEYKKNQATAKQAQNSIPKGPSLPVSTTQQNALATQALDPEKQIEAFAQKALEEISSGINLKVVGNQIKVTNEDAKNNQVMRFAIALEMNRLAMQGTRSKETLNYEYKNGELYLNGGESFDLLKQTVQNNLTKEGLKIILPAIYKLNTDRYNTPNSWKITHEKATNNVNEAKKSSNVSGNIPVPPPLPHQILNNSTTSSVNSLASSGSRSSNKTTDSSPRSTTPPPPPPHKIAPNQGVTIPNGVAGGFALPGMVRNTTNSNTTDSNTKVFGNRATTRVQTLETQIMPIMNNTQESLGVAQISDNHFFIHGCIEYTNKHTFGKDTTKRISCDVHRTEGNQVIGLVFYHRDDGNKATEKTGVILDSNNKKIDDFNQKTNIYYIGKDDIVTVVRRNNQNVENLAGMKIMRDNNISGANINEGLGNRRT